MYQVASQKEITARVGNRMAILKEGSGDSANRPFPATSSPTFGSRLSSNDRSSPNCTANIVRNRSADLSEFTAITEDAAALGPHKTARWGWDVDLDGLSTISLAVAEQLVLHTSNLSLSGLTTITDEVAKVLATHKGDGLKLNGLTNLSEAAAQSLRKYKGGGGYSEGLQLKGLASISDAVAASFGKHRGRLTLDGLTSLSDAAAKSLAKT